MELNTKLPCLCSCHFCLKNQNYTIHPTNLVISQNDFHRRLFVCFTQSVTQTPLHCTRNLRSTKKDSKTSSFSFSKTLGRLIFLCGRQKCRVVSLSARYAKIKRYNVARLPFRCTRNFLSASETAGRVKMRPLQNKQQTEREIESDNRGRELKSGSHCWRFLWLKRFVWVKKERFA